MRKNEEVIRAWLDGKAIEYLNSWGWAEWNDNEDDHSPMADRDINWRVKPELKKVDYQVLIDAKLFVKFTMMHHAIISRLTQINWDNLYMDDNGTSWDGIMFEEGLKQVVSASTFKKLILAGFDLQEILSYSDDSVDDEQVLIILEGVREGYTL